MIMHVGPHGIIHMGAHISAEFMIMYDGLLVADHAEDGPIICCWAYDLTT